MLKYIRLYFLIGSQYAKSRMSYRADFFISIFGTIFWFIPSFFGIVVIFTNIPSLSGWSLDELIFIYGFYILAMEPNGILFGNAWGLSSQIRSGNFIKYYFRPINMMFYFMTERYDLTALWVIPAGIGLIIWSSIKLGIVWNAVKIIVALSLLCSASLVFIGLMVAAASSAFWLTNSHSLLMLVSRFRENARYPLTIYSTALKMIFSTILPIGFAVFYPAQWILRPDEAGIAPYFTPLVGVGCFLVAYLIWHAGTKRWSGTGT